MRHTLTILFVACLSGSTAFADPDAGTGSGSSSPAALAPIDTNKPKQRCTKQVQVPTDCLDDATPVTSPKKDPPKDPPKKDPPKRPAPPRKPSAKPPEPQLTIETSRFEVRVPCPAGGTAITIKRGSEVVEETFSCDGSNGTNGHIARIVPGPAFKADPRWCNGNPGVYVDTYIDMNDDGTHDVDEPSSHVGATCDPPPVAKSKDGRPGHDGTTVGVGVPALFQQFWAKNAPSVQVTAFGIALMVQHDWAEVTLKALWSPGRKHGDLFAVDFGAYVLWNRVGPWIGAELFYADIDSQNRAHLQFILATPGVAFRVVDGRNWKVRAETHVPLGMVGTYGQFHNTMGIGGSLAVIYGF